MGYFCAHWRGDLSLTKSVLLNGLLGYLLFTVLSRKLFGMLLAPSDSWLIRAFFICFPAIFFAWYVWALVGIVRSAVRAVASPGNSRLHRFFAGLALLGTALVLAATAQTFWELYKT